jgi:TRAP transporter TAXI family solute receptor
MHRRRRLLLIACLCVCIGLGAAVVWFFFFAHFTLRVATGPVGSDGQKFLAAFVRSVADAHPRVRLQVVPMADREASAKALKEGAVDLAVVRSDELTSTTGKTIAILRRDVVGFVVPSYAALEKVGNLTGKTIGLMQGPAGDERILDQILEYYQVPAQKVNRVVLTPGEIGPAIRQKRVAAIFAIAPAGPGVLADVVTAVAKASKGIPDILEIEAAEAIAQRFPVLEDVDIAPGAFRTTPLRPEDSVTTLAVTLRLVARSSMSNYVAGEVARLLFATKAKLVSTFPQVSQIEAPDTDMGKGATLPVHPGATAYFDGEPTSLLETLLDKFLDYSYLVAVFGGIIGAGYAWMRSTWRDTRSQTQAQLLRLLSILRDVPTVDLDALDAFDKEVETINAWALERVTQKEMEAEQFQLFSQVVTQVWQAMDRRHARQR